MTGLKTVNSEQCGIDGSQEGYILRRDRENGGIVINTVIFRVQSGFLCNVFRPVDAKGVIIQNIYGENFRRNRFSLDFKSCLAAEPLFIKAEPIESVIGAGESFYTEREPHCAG